MGHRLSKIYTRTGDLGTTGLGDGTRVAKDSLRVEAYGAVDEVNSTIGVILAHGPDAEVTRVLLDVQHDLFDLGGELCIPEMRIVKDDDVARLERELDAFNDDLEPLKDFVLPGGPPAATFCHLARTIARRAERRVVSLAAAEDNVAPVVVRYLNRLSDLLFVLARHLTVSTGHAEQLWEKDRRQ